MAYVGASTFSERRPILSTQHSNHFLFAGFVLYLTLLSANQSFRLGILISYIDVRIQAEHLHRKVGHRC